MSVYFTSDLHLGHKNIHKFRGGFSSEEEHQTYIIKCWKATITKRDDVYVLGDACFTMEAVDLLRDLPGTKHLIRGNHDELDTQAYLKVFKNVYGLKKYKEFWLSHAPIHPQELRGKVNLHGHVHYDSVKLPFNPVTDVKQNLDNRYFNCCVENLRDYFRRPFVELDQLRKHLIERSNARL